MEKLISKNDNAALTELYGRYSHKLLGYFIKMFRGDKEKAQDFLQDLFMKIMDKKHSFDTNKRFYTWVFTIASNMCKTEFRKPYLHDIDHADIEHLSIANDNLADKKIFKSLLKSKVHQLEIHHKTVFILRYNEQFSLKEIAEITETSVGTVKSRLFYATKKITDQLKEYDPKNESNLFKIN